MAENIAHFKDVPYSNHSSLNTLDICIPGHDGSTTNGKVWIVYIHGGAWRDPLITSSSFTSTQTHLLASPVASQIAGYASLNYRLSPHPQHSAPLSDPARNAAHPDHINDILDALRCLQSTYGFGERYILAGHSCGATLALQVGMARTWTATTSTTSSNPSPGTHSTEPIPPLAILALEGLYDLPALVAYHASEPVYETFVRSAFGPDPSAWKAASPTSAQLTQTWRNGRLVVLAHSHGDELVEWEQVERMRAALVAQGWGERGLELESESEPGKGRATLRGSIGGESVGAEERRVALLELQGSHHGVWEEGSEVARAVECTVRLLRGMEGSSD